MNPALEGLAASLLAGGAGYVASKLIGNFADLYLPESVPYRPIIGTGLSAVVAAFAAERFLKDRPKVAAGVTVGAMIPLVEQIVAMTSFGPSIGLYAQSSDGGSAPMLPAPGGMGANLAAALSASLSEGSSWSPADY